MEIFKNNFYNKFSCWKTVIEKFLLNVFYKFKSE